MKNRTNILFWLIIVIAVVLRFWQLGNVPPSPDWDEASLGYNAYSIMMTGRDEYGKLLPVILRSFDDYKPGLYAYFIIPFIKLFDLNLVAVRFPSAIFGVLAVIATYFLARELFPNTKKYSARPASLGEAGVFNMQYSVAVIAALLLAISPWHIQFSRIAFEAQVGLALNIGAVLFFLKGLKRGPFLLLSALLASMSIYMYQSEKVYLPILFVALAAIFWKELLKSPKKWIVLAVLTGAIICIPMVASIFIDQNAFSRAKGVSIFSDQTVFLKKNAEKFADDKQRGDILGQVFDNRRVEYAKAIVSGYISHFNFNWLFIIGDNERHHAPSMGLLYLFELPFFLIGIYMLVFGNYSKKSKLTILAIFLIAPIPASVTSGVPHAVRAINFLPTFQIFTAIGLITALRFVFSIQYRVFSIKIAKLLAIVYLLFAVSNISYYLNQYFVQQNYYYSQYWQYGYEKAIDFIKPIKSGYNKVIVSNQAPLDQSYIFFLYYLKFDPKTYQELGGTETGGFAETHRGFDNLTFRSIDWSREEKGNLIVGRPEDFPSGIAGLKTINFLNGRPAIKIVEK